MTEIPPQTPKPTDLSKTAMQSQTQPPALDTAPLDMAPLLTSHLWGDLDRPGAVLVDIGNHHGECALAIAGVTRDMKFIVQDAPETAEAGRAALPEALRDRVEFMAHDPLAEQPVKGAEVYIFSGVMQRWREEDAVKILRALVPALWEGRWKRRSGE